MREIIFRGKRIGNDIWVYGGIIKTYHPNFSDPDCYAICAYGKDIFVEQDTIGQYTGLKDKNGKKIFEGDIIDVSDCEYIPHWINETKIKVQWDIERAGFDPFCEDAIDCREYVSADEVEVIGNIFDSPELLEENK